MPSLRIEIAGQVFQARLTDAPVRIGRGEGCDLRIDAPEVSALHASIEPVASGGYRVVDAKSGRPTRVNGAVVVRLSLKGDDVLEIGPARITYLDDVAQAPLAPTPAAPVAPAVAVARPPVAVARPPVAVARPPVAVATPAVPDEGHEDVEDVEEAVGADAPAAARPTPAPGGAPPVTNRASSARLTRALVTTAGFAVVALAVAFWVRHRGGETSVGLEAWKGRLDAAVRLADDDPDGAIAALDALVSSTPVEGVRRNAAREAEYVRKRIEAAGRDVHELVKRAPVLSADRLAAELELLRARHGPVVLARHEAALNRLDVARQEALARRSAEAEAEAKAFVVEGRFADALARWDLFVAGAPGDESARALSDAGRAAVDSAAVEAFKALVVAAEGVVAEQGPRAAAILVRERLPRFAGTSAAPQLAMRAAAYDHDAVVHDAALAAAAAARAPGPTRPPGTAPGASPPAVPGTAPQPAPSGGLRVLSAVDRARVVALLTDADAHAAGRRFREALAALSPALPIAEGTAEAPRVEVRRDDLELAQRAFLALIATVRAHPDRFASVEIAPKYLAALVSADEEHLTAAVRGGRTRVRWASLDATRTAALVEAAGLPSSEALGVAAFLREVGAKEASERLLLHLIGAGAAAGSLADRAALDARIARWRGEPVPEGGYVAYEGRLVSPRERERLVFEARVTAACKRVGSKDGKERRAAYEELRGLGASAREAFVAALRARRTAAAAEVAGAKVFTSSRTRQRLLDELAKRRAAALALIDDDKAYPYPYAPNQAEIQGRVDALVDAVREVWERPFDLVAAWDKGVDEALGVVREVDEVLAREVEGYTADLDAVKAAVNRAIDVPAAVAEPYDRDVLAFNEKVATSATPQEKQNVRLVNAYRIMMGRQAVKLEERLVRAARGHSIEMRTLNYFAHESPTPGRESPGKRCALEGYASGVSENIAFGSGFMNAQGAFDGWYRSSGHHRNMLGRAWTELGVGRSSRATDSASYWTQNFGAMGGKSLRTPDPLPAPRAAVAPEVDPEDAAAARDAAEGAAEGKDGAGRSDGRRDGRE